jgi:hypothetical protein
VINLFQAFGFKFNLYRYAVRALRDPRSPSDTRVSARRDVEMLTAALGEDEAADIAAQVMAEEDAFSDEDDDGGTGGGRGAAAVEIVDAEEAYEQEKAVLRAELEEIQSQLQFASADARTTNASPEEVAKYAADLERLKVGLYKLNPVYL